VNFKKTEGVNFAPQKGALDHRRGENLPVLQAKRYSEAGGKKKKLNPKNLGWRRTPINAGEKKWEAAQACPQKHNDVSYASRVR